MKRKKARRYEFYLSVYFNDGSVIPDELFTLVETRLLDRFSGLTSQQRAFANSGIWRHQNELFRDQVVLVEALDFRKRGSSRFVREFKTWLLEAFDQLEMLITEISLRVH